MKSLFATFFALLVAFSGAQARADVSTTGPSKVWVTELPAFLNATPGNWIVGRSTAVALSAAEAESRACQDAAAALVEKLRPQLSRPSDAPGLARQVQAALARGDLIVDRQVVSHDRPYGTIWSAAVLIDASARKLDPLLQQLERSARHDRIRTFAAVTGAAVLAGGVGIAYLLLNALTRGFLRFRLALASVLIIAVGIVGIAGLL